MSSMRPRKRLRMSVGTSGAKRLALRFAFKGAKSLIKTRMRKRTARDAPAVTFQHDQQLLYRRRPAPSRVKRFMRRKTQFINKVVNNKFPTDLYRFQFTANVSSAAGNVIQYTFIPMYTGGANQQTLPIPQLAQGVYQQLYRLFWTNSPPTVTTIPEGTLQFSNASMEVTIHSDVANGTNVSIVDVYHVTCRRSSEASAEYLFEQGFVNKSFTVLDPNGTAQLSPLQLGNTCFDSTHFCRYFLIKNVRQFRISSGNLITLNLTDRKEYTVNSSIFTPTFNSSGNSLGTMNCVKGLTEGYFLIFRGGPVSGAGATGVILNISAQVDYRYRFMESHLATARVQTSFPT